MTVRFSATMSLDGFIAGPNQSEENPLGEGGMALHEWLFPLEAWRRSHGLAGGEVNASSPIVEELESGFGAVVMGRTCSVPFAVRRVTIRGPAGGATSRRTTHLCSFSPTTRSSRSN